MSSFAFTLGINHNNRTIKELEYRCIICKKYFMHGC